MKEEKGLLMLHIGKDEMPNTPEPMRTIIYDETEDVIYIHIIAVSADKLAEVGKRYEEEGLLVPGFTYQEQSYIPIEFAQYVNPEGAGELAQLELKIRQKGLKQKGIEH